ncbi:MAG: isoprenylcysteine carboxylmethyltransferase family protein [Aquidulcibacter sp.]|jgi:protein-S-isoprenylcysteine O-methyltransferase Ste14|uniref:methyltransferase family protein n=1 Tax=Aquidulcibacter sp. TaxID=2052990 RepID=UPI0022C6D60C|nr:isoprenylcysteine carboxylmethyltransferase family protein [Aquidulcibacter sp.]
MEVLLLVYVLVYLTVTFVWPTWRLWRVHGINGLVLPRDDSAHGLIGKWFKGLMASILVFAILLAAGVSPAQFGPIPWAKNDAVQQVGHLLLLVSLGWITSAQYQMGRSWRIGFNEDEMPDLVTSGLFARSRNPIFLGMRVTLLGLFLVFPCAVTLTILALSEALIAIQVRLEEAHLSKSLGDKYLAYVAVTPRWI